MTTDASFSSYMARVSEFIRKNSENETAAIHSRSKEGEEQFNDLALNLFALQFQHNPAYRRFCEAQQASPAGVTHWSGIPSLSTRAFKAVDLTSFPSAQRTQVFCSSGTTELRPSRHYHDAESLAVYAASLLPWFRMHLLADVGPRTSFGASTSSAPGVAREGSHEGICGDVSERELPPAPSPALRMIFLTPPAALAPHSSLVHMFETVRREFGAPDSLFAGKVDTAGAWALDFASVRNAMQAAVSARRPVALLGTAFNFVHLLEHLIVPQRSYHLPAGSRVMETGGYKGRSRSIPKTELHKLITEILGVPPSDIVCEYGMCELSSQAYDHIVGTKRNLADAPSVFCFPPWTRARIVSPEDGQEVSEGETGLIRVYDLANVRSVLAVQTEDLGVRRGDGIALIGRAALAEPRGCSLAAL